jgi:hypothetical protein
MDDAADGGLPPGAGGRVGGGLVVLLLLAWMRYPLVSVLIAAGCFALMLVCFYDALLLLASFLP